jgi:hypothetical protein
MPDNTTIKVVDFNDIDSAFGGVETNTIITPDDTTKTVLTGEEEVNLDPKDLAKTTPVVNEEEEEVIGDPVPTFDDLTEQAEEDNKKAGRSKTDKSGLVELYSKQIEDGKMVAFSDFEVESTDPEYKTKLRDYLAKFSMKDFEELHEANVNEKIGDIEEKVPQEFYNSLPRELQYAAKYVADGGQDMKGLFKALSQVEEVRQLDPKENAREVAYQYLKATNYGDDSEINEQLDEWEDLGSATLVKKAEGFKPKLDKMQEQIVERKLAEQEYQRTQREQAAQAYVQNVQEALKTPELAGVKLDKKTHDFLTQGLLQPAYTALNGQKTNLLGYMLERHQVVEPNYQLVAEALWLLSDPDTYHAKMAEKGGNAQTTKIARTLKTAEQNRLANTAVAEVNEDTSRTPKRAGLSRPKNILAR